MLSSNHSDFFAFRHSSEDISDDILVGLQFGGTAVFIPQAVSSGDSHST